MKAWLLAAFFLCGTAQAQVLAPPDASGLATNNALASAQNASLSGTTAVQNAITAAVITVPASGTAPTGATPLAAGKNVVTTCATNGALQLPTATALPQSSTVMVDNRSANACLLYPPSGGTIGALAANVPTMIPPGHYSNIISLGPSAFVGFSTFHRSYLVPNITITVPAVGANQTVNITAVSGNSMVQVGDECTYSVVTSTTLPAGLILSGVTNTGTAGQILIRAANVQTLATTASASVTASFNCGGP